VQSDPQHPTGTVKVEVDCKGQARYQIAHPVAWDFLEWTPAWRHLAEAADAICFGSLAQRSEESRATIRCFLRASPNALKVFDVNLRQAYYSQKVLAESMKLADIVKLNDEELPKIMSLANCPDSVSRRDADGESGVGMAGADVYCAGGLGCQWVSAGSRSALFPAGAAASCGFVEPKTSSPQRAPRLTEVRRGLDFL
jgi:sugar/nucleoside kinase (ribokinase family)